MFCRIGLIFSCCSAVRLRFSDSIFRWASASGALACCTELSFSMLAVVPGPCCAGAVSASRNMVVASASKRIRLMMVSFIGRITIGLSCRMIRNLRLRIVEVQTRHALLNKVMADVQEKTNRARESERHAQKRCTDTAHAAAAGHGADGIDSGQAAGFGYGSASAGSSVGRPLHVLFSFSGQERSAA